MAHSFPIELLRPYWLPKLQQVKGVPLTGFKAWLTNGLYTFNSNATGNSFHLNVNGESSLVGAFVADISRMATACFESIHAIQKTPKVPKSTAWALIRLYYAAFFAAHATMRMFGISCSHLEQGHINYLKEYADTLGYSWTGTVTRGFFVCQYDPTSRELLCSRKSDTHAETWKAFNKYLRDLSTKVLSERGITHQKNITSSFLIALGDSLQDFGNYEGGNWLSQFRNRLNYQHDYGAWFPYRDAQIRFENIERRLKRWNSDLGSITLSKMRTKEADRFIEACVTVVALCNAFLDDVRSVSTLRRSFPEYSSLAFLRQAQMV